MKVDALSEDEISLVIQHIDAHYRPLFATLAYNGTRPNELAVLRWSDIDLVRKTISVSKGRVRGLEGLPKTEVGERELPILQPAEDALTWLKEQRQNQPVVSINDSVFVTKKGEPINKHLDPIGLVL